MTRTDFIIELKVERTNSQATMRTLTEWRRIAWCWLWFGDDEQFGAGMKKQPIVDQDNYKGERVALDPTTDAVLSHSRSLADADGQAIEQWTEGEAATCLGLSRERCLAMLTHNVKTPSKRALGV